MGLVLGALLWYTLKPAKDTSEIEQRMDMLEQELLSLKEDTSEIEGALTGGAPIETLRCSVYMNIPGIPGECEETMYKDWIEVISWTQNIVKEDVMTAPEFGVFTVTKYVDKSSPKLAQHLCSGTQFDRIVIVMVSGNGTTMTYTLTDAVIVGLTTHPPSVGFTVRHMEDVSLTYRKIEWTYVTSGGDGEPPETVSAGWDIVENKPT